MAKISSQELDAVYHALSNSTRRKILTRLCKSPLSVGELAEPFDISLAAISKHIKKLYDANLIVKTRSESTITCSINLEPIQNAAALIHYFEQFITVKNEASSAELAKIFKPQEAREIVQKETIAV